MIKLLGFVLLVLALAWGFAWLADRPGDITILWENQQIELSVMVAVTLIVALFAVIMFIWWLIRTIWTSPRSINRYFRARKRDRGYQAVSTGLIAASAGDAATARKMNARARAAQRRSGALIHLLEAQASLIEGRHDEARRKFEQMAKIRKPGTRPARPLSGGQAPRRGRGSQPICRTRRREGSAPAWAAEASLETKTRLGVRGSTEAAGAVSPFGRPWKRRGEPQEGRSSDRESAASLDGNRNRPPMMHSMRSGSNRRWFRPLWLQPGRFTATAICARVLPFWSASGKRCRTRTSPPATFMPRAD